MKKALVLNSITFAPEDTCCGLFKTVDELKCLRSSKEYNENNLTNKINDIASKGFKFVDEKVFPHNVWAADGTTYPNGLHGVIRFTNSTENPNYKVYFGPIIEIDPSLGKAGCGKIGCGSLGCGNFGFGNFGCGKLGGKGCGCGKSTPNDRQYTNFFDNEKNDKEVKGINKAHGYRKTYNRSTDDYEFLSAKIGSVMSDILLNYFDQIVEQYEREMQMFASQGFGFEKVIDTPSKHGIYTQAMLLSTNSNSIPEISRLELQEKTIYLSRFDVFYNAQQEDIDEDELGIITDENLKRIQEVYEEDFNQQEDFDSFALKAKQIKENTIRIPITFATKRKSSGFLAKINGKTEYDFTTILVNAEIK